MSNDTTTQPGIEASFSTLVMSIGSSAAMALGLSPNPSTGKMEKDRNMARFNIDLLEVLEQKTTNNLSGDEAEFLKRLISDLKLKYVELKD